MGDYLPDTPETSPDGSGLEAQEPDVSTQDDPTTDDYAAQEQYGEPEQPPVAAAEEWTPERIIEASTQKTQSWLGRRDAELMRNIGQVIESRIAALSQQQYQHPVQQHEQVDPSERLLENPDAYIDSVVSRKIHQQESFNQAIIHNIGRMMDGDQLFQDRDLGNAVINEIKNNIGRVDKRYDPTTNASLLLSNAVSSVYRNQKLGKQNPLHGNKPSSVPLGSVGAPAAARAKPKVPKLSAEAAKLAKRFGYKEDDLAKVFGE